MSGTMQLLIHAMTDPAAAVRLAAAPARVQRRVRTVAQIQRVLPVIGARLLESGEWHEFPASLLDYLAGRDAPTDLGPAAVLALQLNRRRRADLQTQLADIAGLFDAHAIDWVPLKGAAVLLDALWPDPDEREMTDLDLLILNEAALLHAERLLQDELGYRQIAAEFRPLTSPLGDRHQLCALELPDRAGTVELHRALVPDEFAPHLPLPAHRLHPAASGSRLEPRLFVEHVTAHAMISDWGRRTLRPSLRSILDTGHMLRTNPDMRDGLAGAPSSALLATCLAAQLVAADELVPPESGHAARASRSARLWWAAAKIVAGSPRRSAIVRYVSMFPVFLRSERMRARIGGHAEGTVLGTSVGIVVRRLVAALRDLLR